MNGKLNQTLQKLGPAAVRLAQMLGLTDQGENRGENQTNPVLHDATYKDKEDNSVRVEPPEAKSVGAPTPEIKKPRWLVSVARGGEGELASLLYRVAREVARNRQMARATGTLVIHLPVDLIAAHLGVDRTTVWRWAKELEEHGLIARRTHYGTLEGRTVATGTVWAIRLKPGKARLTYEDLAHPWRAMEADVARGATAWAWKKEKATPSLADLLGWALGARRGPGSPAPRAGAPVDLGAIPYLQEASREEIPGLITALAEHLAHLLRDPGSRRFYAGLLWKVVRGELDGWALYQAVQRVLVDLKEGWARRPGALLASRLKA